ncbi:MAG TPA: hypothetical protein VGE40_00715 [Bacilli bacterium]
MPKSKRGRVLWNLPSRSRGTCLVCKATRIKLLFNRTNAEGKQLKLCKKCSKATQERIDLAQ